jgi:hypothetical protein
VFSLSLEWLKLLHVDVQVKRPRKFIDCNPPEKLAYHDERRSAISRNVETNCFPTRCKDTADPQFVFPWFECSDYFSVYYNRVYSLVWIPPFWSQLLSSHPKLQTNTTHKTRSLNSSRILTPPPPTTKKIDCLDIYIFRYIFIFIYVKYRYIFRHRYK